MKDLLSKRIELGGKRYIIYSNGNLINEETGKQVAKSIMSSGYNYFAIKHKTTKKQINVSAHRLVAISFVKNQNPEKFDMVNHIDGVKTNNDYRNLEWCDRSQNMKHAYKLGLIKNKYIVYGQDNPASRQVSQLDLNGNEISRFSCIAEAARITGAVRQDISKVCKGKRKTSGGFIWKYV
jgi:hypothetical protein